MIKKNILNCNKQFLKKTSFHEKLDCVTKLLCLIPFIQVWYQLDFFKTLSNFNFNRFFHFPSIHLNRCTVDLDFHTLLVDMSRAGHIPLHRKYRQLRVGIEMSCLKGSDLVSYLTSVKFKSNALETHKRSAFQCLGSRVGSGTDKSLGCWNSLHSRRTRKTRIRSHLVGKVQKREEF